MRNPNGFGSVYKLSGKRRRPWIARVTTGWSLDNKQEYYTIGYFETRAKGIRALSEYHKNPIAERGDVTLGTIYEEWSKGKYDKVSDKTVEMYNSAWNHLKPLSKEKVRDIKTSHLQEIINNMKLSRSSCQKVKILAGQLLKYAMADDIINKNYAEFVSLPPSEGKEKEIFSDIEIKAIEDNTDDPWVSTILILIYTGMRIGELLTLTKFNVDMKQGLIKGGLKTEAGRNRTIPIHHKIKPQISRWMTSESEYLINREGKKIRTDYYRKYLYYPALERLGIRKLTIHTTRHTFATLMANAKVDTKSIQEIIGHSDYSTTANIYTHLDIESLRKAINSI